MTMIGYIQVLGKLSHNNLIVSETHASLDTHKHRMEDGTSIPISHLISLHSKLENVRV
jgi:hypothetical protein